MEDREFSVEFPSLTFYAKNEIELYDIDNDNLLFGEKNQKCV